MNKLVKKQRGMTAIGWLIVLGMLSFFVLLVLRLAPGYLEFYKVKSVVESLKNEPYIGNKTPMEIRSLLQRRIDVNAIDSIQAKDIKITQQSGKTTVTAQYEVRVPIMGNVDAVSKFEDSIEVVAH
jgi:hypothetical protein